jgi:hypothetical protein
LVASGVVAALSAGVSCRADPDAKATPRIEEAHTFQGGTFEASGAVQVPAADGILFVDNARPDEVLWMAQSRDGRQYGGIARVPLGVRVEDPEGITTDGSRFYVVGSQSRKRAADGPGLVRFTFDPNRRRVERVEAIALHDDLVARVPELRDRHDLDVEGLAWDPVEGRLLLGLRSPVMDGDALVIALKVRKPDAPLTASGIEIDGRPLRIALGGAGVRSLEYDSQARGFRLIAAAENADEEGEEEDFQLLDWFPATGRLRPVARIARRLKPEGVARAVIAGRSVTVIVCDSSRYFILP